MIIMLIVMMIMMDGGYPTHPSTTMRGCNVCPVCSVFVDDAFSVASFTSNHIDSQTGPLQEERRLVALISFEALPFVFVEIKMETE